MRDKNKNIFKRAGLIFAAIFAVALSFSVMATPVFADDPDSCSACETAILPDSWCCEDGIQNITLFVVKMFYHGATVVGIIGVVICGVLYMTARDNESQVANAKKRLVDVIIGVALLAMLSIVLDILLPDPSNVKTELNLDAQNMNNTVLEEKYA